jgi:hypothetical protein
MRRDSLSNPARFVLLASTLTLLAIVLYRGVAILLSDPLLALANNYDMIRVQACVKAYPVRPAEIPPYAGNADAPIERYQFRHDVGAPCFRSTEVLFARLARPLFKAESRRSADGSFSIRWLGIVKFSAFFAAVVGFSIAWWRRGQHGASLANAAVVATVLTDPAVTLYLNGFYAEFSTVLFGYASIAGAALLMGRQRPPGMIALVLLALSVAAFVGTKIQHIGLGLVLALSMALPTVAGLKISGRTIAAIALGGAVGLAFQAINLSKSDNDTMRLANLTSTILTTLLPQSDDPYRTAANVGIPRHCGAYAGLNWYLPPVREDPTNHPCREVRDASYLRLLGLAWVEPQVFGSFLGRSLAFIRPWIPSTYRGVPHLGVVEGQRRAHLPEGWLTWSRWLDLLPLWSIYALVLSPAVIMAVALVSRRIHCLPLACVLTALALLPYPVIVAVTFGNGYEDSAKQMHLVFTTVLSFWTLLALASLARAMPWLGSRRSPTGAFAESHSPFRPSAPMVPGRTR